nr:unnamed protein product [Callosobruchus analis]
MSKHRNQTVIIPPDQVTPDEALVIEIPQALKNKPVVIAQARAGIQVKRCCDTTDYSMFLNNLQSSKSAPGVMAAGNYIHSSTQYGGTTSQYGGAAAEYSHSGPTQSQTIGGPDKQCGNLTANIFIQTPNKVTSAMTTSTDSFDDYNKSNTPPSVSQYQQFRGSIKNLIRIIIHDVCFSTRLEPPPCPPQLSTVSCKPSVSHTFTSGYCKVHCSKCCELASGNRYIYIYRIFCCRGTDSDSDFPFRRPSLLTMEELERIKMKFLETKIKLNNLIKCTTPRNARSANPIACSGGQSYTSSFTSNVSSNTSGPCQICDNLQQSQHHCP